MTADKVKSNGASAEKGREALCQDCLRVKMTYSNTNDGKCECGGDLCFCGGCLSTIQKLRDGHRDAKTLGTQRDIDTWDEHYGIKPDVEVVE